MGTAVGGPIASYLSAATSSGDNVERNYHADHLRGQHAPWEVFMMSSQLATAASAAGLTLVLVLGLTYREPLFRDHSDLRLTAVFAWACSPLAFLANALWNHRPSVLLLWVLAAVYLTVSAVTLGRPALVMDQLLLGEKDLRKQVGPELRRRIALSQGAMIVGIVAIAVVWTRAA